MVFISIIFSSFGQVLIKWGTMNLKQSSSEQLQDQMLRYFTNQYIVSGISLYVLSMAVWVFAISKIQLSTAYPMVAFGYVIVFILSYFLFNEPISIMKIVGLGTIVLGVIIIAKA